MDNLYFIKAFLTMYLGSKCIINKMKCIELKDCILNMSRNRMTNRCHHLLHMNSWCQRWKYYHVKIKWDTDCSINVSQSYYSIHWKIKGYQFCRIHEWRILCQIRFRKKNRNGNRIHLFCWYKRFRVSLKCVDDLNSICFLKWTSILSLACTD